MPLQAGFGEPEGGPASRRAIDLCRELHVQGVPLRALGWRRHMVWRRRDEQSRNGQSDRRCRRKRRDGRNYRRFARPGCGRRPPEFRAGLLDPSLRPRSRGLRGSLGGNRCGNERGPQRDLRASVLGRLRRLALGFHADAGQSQLDRRQPYSSRDAATGRRWRRLYARPATGLVAEKQSDPRRLPRLGGRAVQRPVPRRRDAWLANRRQHHLQSGGRRNPAQSKPGRRSDLGREFPGCTSPGRGLPAGPGRRCRLASRRISGFQFKRQP